MRDSIPAPFTVQVFESLPSTNDHVLERIRRGVAGGGEVCVARAQVAGRGRMGRQWVAEPGGLWFTVAMPLHGRSFGWAGLLTALAVCRALDAEGLRAGVKWPNDVVVDGKKLAGVLVEAVAGRGLAAVGVGLNVANPLPGETGDGGHRPEGVVLETGDGGGLDEMIDAADRRLSPTASSAAWPPTSVARETGREVDPQALLPSILAHLDELWRSWAAGRHQELLEAWSERDACRGRRVRLLPDGPVGAAEGIDATGALRVRLAEGGVHLALAGELAFVG